MIATVSPENILREMSDLWVSLGQQPEGESRAGVLRACSMTLLVASDEVDDPRALGETLSALMPEHPSRAIVLRFRASPDRVLSARVLAQCWLPFGHRRQICCEQIEITASDASLPDVPAVVLPLTVPDLPVALWCRNPRLFRLAEFGQLASLAQKLILDSAGFPDPPAVLGQLADLARSGRRLGDLAWTRLTRWREMIAQIFENRAYLARLPQVSELRLRFAGGSSPVEAWYMAAWLADSLVQAGSQPRLGFQETAGQVPGELTGVELVAGETRFSVGLVEGRVAEIRVDGIVNRTALPRPSDYLLLREELSIPGRDPVYERTLAAAAALALSST